MLKQTHDCRPHSHTSTRASAIAAQPPIAATTQAAVSLAAEPSAAKPSAAKPASAAAGQVSHLPSTTNQRHEKFPASIVKNASKAAGRHSHVRLLVDLHTAAA